MSIKKHNISKFKIQIFYNGHFMQKQYYFQYLKTYNLQKHFVGIDFSSKHHEFTKFSPTMVDNLSAFLAISDK